MRPQIKRKNGRRKEKSAKGGKRSLVVIIPSCGCDSLMSTVERLCGHSVHVYISLHLHFVTCHTGYIKTGYRWEIL